MSQLYKILLFEWLQNNLVSIKRTITVVLFVMFLSCTVSFARQAETNTQNAQLKQQVDDKAQNREQATQRNLSELQHDNEVMKQQLQELEKEVDRYRNDVRDRITMMNTDMALWLGILTILMALLGVIAPLWLNKKYEKVFDYKIEDLKNDICEAKTNATEAQKSLETITGLKAEIELIKKKIDKSEVAAENSAKEAKASEFFAQALNEQKDPNKAIELYTQSIELNPNSRAYNNRGIMKSRTMDFVGAMQDFDKAIELDPDDDKAYLNRAIVKSDMKDYEGSMLDFRKAIDLNPNNDNAFYNRGNTKSKMNDLDGAMDDFNKAIELNPMNDKAYITRGMIKSEMRDYEGALLDCDKAIELNPKSDKAYFNRGHAKLMVNDQVGALYDYDKAIELNPNNESAYIYRGQLKSVMKDNLGALVDYDKAIEINPNSVLAYFNRGNEKLAINDYLGSSLDFDKVIELNPKYASAYNNKGYAELLMQKFRNALLNGNKALEIDPEMVEAYVTRGRAKMGLEDYAGSLSDLTKAVEIRPDIPEPYIYRAECYRKLSALEQNADKKNEFIQNAEADERIADQLNKH